MASETADHQAGVAMSIGNFDIGSIFDEKFDHLIGYRF